MFERMYTSSDGSAIGVQTWNTSVCFQDGFPSSIAVNGQPVLASPIRLRAGFPDGTAEWTEWSGYFAENTPERMVYLTQAFADSVRINLRITMEQDGLIWYRLLLLPKAKTFAEYDGPEWLETGQPRPRLRSLQLEIPVALGLAELFHFWPREDDFGVTNSGSLTENGLQLSFKSVVWLGNESAGMTFYAESDENWQPEHPDAAITVKKEADSATIRIHFLDSLPELWRRQSENGQYPMTPLRFSFGLQATPVKAYEKVPGYPRDYMQNWPSVPQEDAALDRHLDELASKSVQWYTLHEGWSIVQNYGLPENEEAIRTFVRKVHAHGMKTIPYFGYEFASAAPDFWEHADAFLKTTPDGTYCGGWERKPHQVDYVVCYQSAYSSVMIDRCVHAMDAYGFDGVYLDGTFRPDPCANAKHGCGYTDLDGRRHVTYPLLAVRDHVRRLYQQIHSRGGIVEAHQSSCCAPMILAYCDNYFDGEHLLLKRGQSLTDALDTGVMRAEFTGLNWGIPIQFCFDEDFVGLPAEECCGLFLLYGIDMKAYMNQALLNALSPAWRIMDQFGADSSSFYPFWRTDCPFFASEPDVRCSVWVKDAKALVLAVNLGSEPVEAGILRRTPSGAAKPVKTITVQPHAMQFFVLDF